MQILKYMLTDLINIKDRIWIFGILLLIVFIVGVINFTLIASAWILSYTLDINYHSVLESLVTITAAGTPLCMWIGSAYSRAKKDRNGK